MKQKCQIFEEKITRIKSKILQYNIFLTIKKRIGPHAKLGLAYIKAILVRFFMSFNNQWEIIGKN